LFVNIVKIQLEMTW